MEKIEITYLLLQGTVLVKCNETRFGYALLLEIWGLQNTNVLRKELFPNRISPAGEMSRIGPGVINVEKKVSRPSRVTFNLVLDKGLAEGVKSNG